MMNDDCRYESIKFVVETLTNRMKNKAPLSQDHLSKFEIAVDEVLLDARQSPAPASKTV